MWDRITNFIYEAVRSWSDTTFAIVVGVVFTLGFLFIGNFLKANKKEEPKISKPSQLLWSIVMLIVFILLINIRN